jgi:hypothetical protein
MQIETAISILEFSAKESYAAEYTREQLSLVETVVIRHLEDFLLEVLESEKNLYYSPLKELITQFENRIRLLIEQGIGSLYFKECLNTVFTRLCQV